MLSRKRKGIQSERSIKKRRNRSILMTVLFVLAVAAIVAGLSYLSSAHFVQIQKINIVPASGTALVTPAQEIQTIAEENLTGNWWYLFSKKNSFLFPGDKIVADIMNAFPRVQSVTIEREGWTQWNTLNLIVTERAPFALACDTTDQCFYMDSTGFIFAVAPQFSPGVFVRYYASSTIATSTATSTSQTLRTVAVGNTLIEQSHLDIARQAVDFISKMGIQVVRANILANNEYTIIIKNMYSTSTPVATISANTATTSTSSPLTVQQSSTETSSPVSIIYFNDTTPIEKTLGYFLSFWQSRTNKNFNYIDLRYGNDVVFKMH